MKSIRVAVLAGLMMALLLPLAAVPSEATEAGTSSGGCASVALLRSDALAIELELEVAGYTQRSVPAGDRAYDLIEIAGLGLLSKEGAPQVPVQGSLVGIPPDAQVELEILAAESEKLPGWYNLLPAPTLQVALPQPGTGVSGPASLPRLASQHLVAEEAIYGADAFYPGEIVRLGEPASLRSQRLVAVQFYPVQYNPRSGEVVLYRRVRVRLNLAPGDGYPPAAAPGDRAPAGPLAEPEAFESVLAGALLNYEPARGWRQPPSVSQVLAPSWGLDAPAYRIITGQEGVYQVTYADLEAALGEPLGAVDAGTLQVYNQGQAVAIRVLDEGEAGTFGPGDSVLFYGREYESKYTAENVYWLTYGQGTTLPMGTYDGSPGSGYGEPVSTERSVHAEVNNYYWGLMPGDNELERYWWTAGNATYPMQETADLGQVADMPGDATLRVALIGYNDEPGVVLDHHVEIYVNTQPDPIGDLWWSGVSREIFELSFPHSSLQPGENEFRFVIPGDTGSENELNLLDWFEITYQHEYRAAGDQLSFFGGDPAQDWEYAVGGFTTADPEAYDVYDITDPALPVQVTGAGLDDEGDGTYTLRFEDARRQAARFLAQTVAQRLSPLRVELDTPSDLTSSGGADHIIISHADFLAAMEPLQQQRGSLLVDVQDVYDEFAYGHREPGAIRDFLTYAYTAWGTSYALFVGDGHFDPKDYLGEGRTNYLPARLANVDPWLGEVATDNWYADTQGDRLPDMHIGRLPANTAQEAEAAVAKILGYEALAPAPWMGHLLFVADNPDPGGNFYALSDGIIDDYVPAGYEVHKAYLKGPNPGPPAGWTCSSASACKAEVLARINEGQLITSYVGHAQVEYWAFEKILQLQDIGSMANGATLPVFLPMTCQEGAFHYPYAGVAAFGEAVVMAPGKGAIASWSPTGFGLVTGHDELERGFLDAVFGEGEHIIGEATLSGKLRLWASGANLELVDTYVLFGDPALQLKALEADLRVGKAADPPGTVAPGAVLTYTLTFRNAGLTTAHDVVLTDTIPVELANPTIIYTSPEVVAQRPGAPFAWDLADLPSGAAGEIRIQAEVPLDTLPGTITNEIEIAAAEPDALPDNNQASVSTTVQSPPAWSIYLPLVLK